MRNCLIIQFQSIQRKSNRRRKVATTKRQRFLAPLGDDLNKLKLNERAVKVRRIYFLRISNAQLSFCSAVRKLRRRRFIYLYKLFPAPDEKKSLLTLFSSSFFHFQYKLGIGESELRITSKIKARNNMKTFSELFNIAIKSVLYIKLAFEAVLKRSSPDWLRRASLRR